MGIDPKAKALTLFDEFKNFAFKGNIVDLTIGFIIGAGFTAVVKSAVDNIVMPVVSLVLPDKKGFEGMVWNIGGEHTVDATGKAIIQGGANIYYGKFIGDSLTFLVTAFVVFLVVVKFLGWVMRAKKQEEAAPPPPPAPTKEEILLTEIRDAIRARG